MNALALLLQEEGPNTSLSWLLIVVLVIFFMIVLVGWWVSRNRASQPVVQHDAPVAPAVPAVGEKTADDLTKLEGIGPKVKAVLNETGINSLADLAAADVTHVQEVLNAAGMRYMDPVGWIEQAKLAAVGDTEGLAKLQDELKGGRRVS